MNQAWAIPQVNWTLFSSFESDNSEQEDSGTIEPYRFEPLASEASDSNEEESADFVYMYLCGVRVWGVCACACVCVQHKPGRMEGNDMIVKLELYLLTKLGSLLALIPESRHNTAAMCMQSSSNFQQSKEGNTIFTEHYTRNMLCTSTTWRRDNSSTLAGNT